MIRLRAFLNPACGWAYQFFFWDQDKHAAVENMVFKEVPPGQIISPAFELDITACQELMNSLWNVGIRPTESVPSRGEINELNRHLEAVQYHLEDMRKLAFNGKD